MKVLILGLGMQGSFLVRDVAESDRVSTVIIGDSDLQRLKNQEKFMSGKVETAMSRTTIYPYSIK
jgi:saccharopine dehydrogenase-like NADP-dependent oxidoreductase